MAMGLFALASTLTVLSAVVLLIVGATVDWEEPCSFKLPPWDNVLGALALVILQAICWVMWAGVSGGGS